jgi:hypothetical protein
MLFLLSLPIGGGRKSVEDGICANETIKARNWPHDRPELELQALIHVGFDVTTSLVTYM